MMPTTQSTTQIQWMPLKKSWQQQSLNDYYFIKDSDLLAKTRSFYEFIETVKKNKAYVCQRPVHAACQSETLTSSHQDPIPKQRLLLSSNNYLGFVNDPEIVAAAIAATQKYGVGSGASSLLSGTLDLHQQMEREVATWLNKEDTMIFTSGYAANLGTLGALLRSYDLVLCNERCHASIFDGIKFSGAKKFNFSHNNLEALESLLIKHQDFAYGKLVVVESVYSMDGDIAPLKEIVALTKKYGFKLYVDEAHGVGVFGNQGKGLCAQQEVLDQVDIFMGTFSKAFGTSGGFIAGDKALINYVRHYARSNFFSTSLAPAAVAAAQAALRKTIREPGIRKKLWQNITLMKNLLQAEGLETLNSNSPIIPVIVGDPEKLRALTHYLDEAGIYVSAVEYPAVEREQCRLRISLMASHTTQQLQTAVSKIKCGFVKLEIVQSGKFDSCLTF